MLSESDYKADRDYEDERNRQWIQARADALKAVLGNPNQKSTNGPRDVAYQVNIYAHLIIIGNLPEPEPGTYY